MPFIATLGMMTIARGAASLYSGGRPIDASSDAFTAVADFNLLAIPGLVWIYIIVGIISTIFLIARVFPHTTIATTINTVPVINAMVKII